MTLREAAQQALEALEGKRYTACGWRSDCDKAITALKAALAEQTVPSDCADSHQPVAWMLTDADNHKIRFLEWQQETRAYSGEWIKTPLYAAPPQRKPLTEDEILSLFRTSGSPVLFARAIERAHGIGEKK